MSDHFNGGDRDTPLSPPLLMPPRQSKILIDF